MSLLFFEFLLSNGNARGSKTLIIDFSNSCPFESESLFSELIVELPDATISSGCNPIISPGVRTDSADNTTGQEISCETNVGASICFKEHFAYPPFNSFGISLAPTAQACEVEFLNNCSATASSSLPSQRLPLRLLETQLAILSAQMNLFQ